MILGVGGRYTKYICFSHITHLKSHTNIGGRGGKQSAQNLLAFHFLLEVPIKNNFTPIYLLLCCVHKRYGTLAHPEKRGPYVMVIKDAC